MKTIILAAGFGTRLHPLTVTRPKALLEIGGKTLLDRLMEKLEPFRRIQEVILVTSAVFFLDFFRWRRESPYKKLIQIVDNNVYLPEKRKGAVRDLHLALKSQDGYAGDYLVLCADNYFDFPLSHFLLSCLSHPHAAFVALYDLKDLTAASKFGVVELDSHGQIIDFEEKPPRPKSTHVSMGVYYFPGSIRTRLEEYLETERLNPDRIGDFVAWLAKKEPVYGVEFDGKWFDIGRMESYQEAKKSFDSLLEKGRMKTI